MTYIRPTHRCVSCKRHRPHYAKGRCRTCYDVTRRTVRGRYDAPTGNPGGAGVPRARVEVASRVEDYALVRSDPRVSRAEAARRLGISYRTAERYDARLNAGGA